VDGEEDEVKKPSTKKGDKVMYFKYAGDKMYDSEGAEYIVLADRDILATM
jgi:chaperonin GroES